MCKPLFSCLFLPLLITGCAFGYQARGSLSDVAGEMRGKAYPANSGGGRFLLMDTEKRLICDAQASPPTQSPNPGSCAGEIGQGLAQCSDGREIRFSWEANSCRTWKGSGVDAQGNRLEFRVERR